MLIGLLSRVVPLRKKLWEEQQQRKRSTVKSEPTATAAAAPAAHAELLGPLKLIIMSATLRVQDFVSNTNLFPTPPPVLEVPARQYEVVTHFNRTTPLQDYMNKMIDKVRVVGLLLVLSAPYAWICCDDNKIQNRRTPAAYALMTPIFAPILALLLPLSLHALCCLLAFIGSESVYAMLCR